MFRSTMFRAEDASGGIELMAAILAMFILISMLLAALIGEDTVTPGMSEELVIEQVRQGSPDPTRFVLLSDGRDLFTLQGEKLSVAQIGAQIDGYDGLQIVVTPATSTKQLSQLRATLLAVPKIAEHTASTLPIGEMPDDWVTVFESWRAK